MPLPSESSIWRRAGEPPRKLAGTPPKREAKGRTRSLRSSSGEVRRAPRCGLGDLITTTSPPPHDSTPRLPRLRARSSVAFAPPPRGAGAGDGELLLLLLAGGWAVGRLFGRLASATLRRAGCTPLAGGGL